MLIVPSLDYNLLSVSQLTTYLSCVVIFWPDHCVFKDIQTKQTIGYGIRRGNLYYLEMSSTNTGKLSPALVADSSIKKGKSEIWLWHRRLGHVSFGYLKKLFPSLFLKFDVCNFKCDVCELSKNHRTTFTLYAFLGKESTLPVIISSSLNDKQKGKLLDVLKEHKGALGWTIADIKCINLADCMHYIHPDENAKSTREMQRWLNPNMKEVVRTEVLKLLDAGIIYPISDSSWVSHV